jgi:hypothetical protein
MRTYTWNYEGNEKNLEMYPNFLVFESTVFMDGEYELIERTPNNQLLFRDSKLDRPKFEVPFETETQAKEALDMLLRTWYPADFEDETDGEQSKELTPEQVAAVRFIVHDELDARVEEGRQAVQSVCRNTCGRVTGFAQRAAAAAFHGATQMGVAIWNRVGAAVAGEHQD